MSYSLLNHVRKHFSVYPAVLGYHYLNPLPQVEEINKYGFVFISSDFSAPIPGCTAVQMMTSAEQGADTIMWLEQSYSDYDRMPASEWTDVPTVGFVGRCPVFRRPEGDAIHKGFAERYRALVKIGQSMDICTDFHIRVDNEGDSCSFWNASMPTYKKNGPLFKTNMLVNQYQVCARGNANWSLRFYETLAYGRIPIYIDSGGKFPIDKDFKPHEVPFVWVEYGADPVETLLEFHNRIGGQYQMKVVQERCREFYFENFSQKAQINKFDEIFWGNRIKR
jgi:hypothetical protein